MAGLALTGQILMTVATVDTLPDALKAKTRRLDALAVKGKAEAIDVHELQWQDSDAATMMPGRSPGFSRLAESRLRLIHQGRELEFRAAMTIGRDTNHDIVILDKMTSRNHARIEKRLNKFVLIDQSANGTYVIINGRDEIMLRREDFVLYGSGQIAFGESSKRDPNVTLVEFHSELPRPPLPSGG
jgi:hypothetical protein